MKTRIIYLNKFYCLQSFCVDDDFFNNDIISSLKFIFNIKSWNTVFCSTSLDSTIEKQEDLHKKYLIDIQVKENFKTIIKES